MAYQQIARAGYQINTQGGVVALAYKPMIFAGITSLLVGTLVYHTFLPYEDLPQLDLWYYLLLFAAVSRALAAIWYRLADENLPLFIVVWYVVTAFSALAWASAPILIWPEVPLGQSFLVLVLVGMSGGTLSTLSAMPFAVPFYMTACMTPLLWRLSTHHTEISLSLLALGIVWVIWIVIAGIRAHRTVRDNVITGEQKEKAERRMLHQAYYDELTELPNRRLFLDRLELAINLSRRHETYGALLFIDLDNFKRVNDSLGHQAGDELLSWVASRLQMRLRDTDTAARLGGDEFAVILPSLSNHLDKAIQQAERIAESLNQSIARPIFAGGYEMHVEASIGVASFPRLEEHSLEVLRHADAAMYEAKKAGRNCVRIFNDAIGKRSRKRINTESEIRSALDRDEFVTYYQPQVNETGEVFGLEALVRWNRRGERLLGPEHFLGVAEDSGLIREIQERVFESVFSDMSAPRNLPDNISISVNVSAGEFYREGFSTNIKQMVSAAGFSANRLCIEITESMAMRQVDTVVEVMKDLRDFGVRFAIDDFGTGYSSLAHLKALPVDTLKIDRSFITDIKEGSSDAKIVKAIIAMTNQMGIRTIAEGVENHEVAEYLRKNDCVYHQGWAYGKAEPLENLFPFQPLSRRYYQALSDSGMNILQ